MSVLDTFVFLIQADTKNATKGLQDVGGEMEKTRREIGWDKGQVERDFKSLSGTVEKETGGMTKSIKSMGADFKSEMAGMVPAINPVTAAIAAIGAAVLITTNNIKGMADAVRMANGIGMDARKFNAITEAAKTFGLEANDVRDTMLDMNVALANARADKKSTEYKAFASLGVPLYDPKTKLPIDAERALSTAASRRDAVGPQNWQALMEQTGITDRNFQQMLLDPKFAERAREFYKNGPDNKALQAAKDLSDATTELGVKWDLLKTKLTSDATPALMDFTNRLTNLIDTIRKDQDVPYTEWWDGFKATWDAEWHQFEGWLKGLPKELGNAIFDAIAGAINMVISQLNHLPGVNIDLIKAKSNVTKEPTAPTPGGINQATPDDARFVEQSRKHKENPDLIADPYAEFNPLKQPIPALQAAARTSEMIASAPIIPPSSVTNSRSQISNRHEMKIEKLEVNTQATDAKGIANGIGDGLKGAYGEMINQYDDGRSH